MIQKQTNKHIYEEQGDKEKVRKNTAHANTL